MDYKHLPPIELRARIITPEERREILILASMNQERADVCSADQKALQRFFEMNAALLLRLYQ